LNFKFACIDVDVADDRTDERKEITSYSHIPLSLCTFESEIEYPTC